MAYLNFAAAQIIMIIMLSIIIKIPQYALLLVEYPLRNNHIASVAFFSASVLMQQYIIISTLTRQILILHPYYENKFSTDINIISFFAISIAVYILFTLPAQQVGTKQQNELKALLVSISTLPLFIVSYFFPKTIWHFPGETIRKFISWIINIKIVGPIVKFIFNGASLLILIWWSIVCCIFILSSISNLIRQAITKQKPPSKETMRQKNTYTAPKEEGIEIIRPQVIIKNSESVNDDPEYREIT